MLLTRGSDVGYRCRAPASQEMRRKLAPTDRDSFEHPALAPLCSPRYPQKLRS